MGEKSLESNTWEIPKRQRAWDMAMGSSDSSIRQECHFEQQHLR
jgi:hypothetical protein